MAAIVIVGTGDYSAVTSTTDCTSGVTYGYVGRSFGMTEVVSAGVIKEAFVPEYEYNLSMANWKGLQRWFVGFRARTNVVRDVRGYLKVLGWVDRRDRQKRSMERYKKMT